MSCKVPFGPFVTEEGAIIDEKPCKTLNKEYYNVFATPDPNDSITEKYLYSNEDLLGISK